MVKRYIGVLAFGLFGLVLPLVAAEPAQAVPAPAAPTYTSVGAGSGHSCGLVTGGTVRCWGNNESGQLGDGSFTDRTTPVVVPGLSGVTAISVGGSHSCALLSGGTVRCWGDNSSGEVGDGSVTNRVIPRLVNGLSGAVELDAGRKHSCARLSNGTVKCWGFNGAGQIGDGSTTNREGAVEVSGLAGATRVSAGGNTTCAIVAGGAAKCWGANTFGALGDGSTTGRLTPVPVTGLTGATRINAGSSHTCAVVSAGAVKCWGYNASGQLGDGSTTNRLTPVSVPDVSDATAIAAGEVSTCAVVSAGAVKCWGRNTFGAVGDGTTTDRLSPVPVPGLSGVTAIGLGDAHVCVVAGGGLAKCWGYNIKGQLGDGTSTVRLSPVAVTIPLDGAKSVSAGAASTCAIQFDTTVRCWGANDKGQLGDGTTTDRSSPVPVVGLSGVAAISVGGSHACALLGDTTVKCWGANGSGQLGDGSTTNRTTPVTVTGLLGVTMVSAGYNHTCAVPAFGQSSCWGANQFGQLGDGTTTNRSVPVLVLYGSYFLAISAGDSHSCGILYDRDMACWGANPSGQLGDGTVIDRIVPTLAVNSFNADKIAAGGSHTCAVSSDGLGRWCWGETSSGQIGNGSSGPTDRLTPYGESISGPKFKILGSGDAHSCTVLADGVVTCWGYNFFGQLGNGSTTNQSSRITVPGVTNAVTVATGAYHSCATTTTGDVLCWGRNASGQLGDGTTTGRLLPVSVPTVPGIPTITSAVPANGQVTLSWTAPGSNGNSPLTGYVVTPFKAGVAQAPVAFLGTGTTKVLTGLTNGSSYTFVVAAANGVGTGYDSAPSSAVTPSTVPGAPTIGTAVPGNAQASVTWTTPSSGGKPITGYVVTPFIGAVAQSPVTFGSTATTQVISGLTNGTGYRFKVAAINANGTGSTSAFSNTVVPAIPWAPFASWSAFVTRQHIDLTTVPPTSGELSTWVTALTGGSKTKGDLIEALRRGSDNTTNVDPTARLYRAFLGRAPDAGGLRFWIGRKRAGTWTVTRMADSFAASNEFKTKYGTLSNRQFVTRIYTDVLGRTADTAGVNYWTGKLDRKEKTRGGVMVGFSESNEYKRKQAENTDVAIAYIFLMGRAPTTAETTDWVTRQKAGTSQAALATELLDSTKYATHING